MAHTLNAHLWSEGMEFHQLKKQRNGISLFACFIWVVFLLGSSFLDTRTVLFRFAWGKQSTETMQLLVQLKKKVSLANNHENSHKELSCSVPLSMASHSCTHSSSYLLSNLLHSPPLPHLPISFSLPIMRNNK